MLPPRRQRPCRSCFPIPRPADIEAGQNDTRVSFLPPDAWSPWSPWLPRSPWSSSRPAALVAWSSWPSPRDIEPERRSRGGRIGGTTPASDVPCALLPSSCAWPPSCRPGRPGRPGHHGSDAPGRVFGRGIHAPRARGEVVTTRAVWPDHPERRRAYGAGWSLKSSCNTVVTLGHIRPYCLPLPTNTRRQAQVRCWPYSMRFIWWFRMFSPSRLGVWNTSAPGAVAGALASHSFGHPNGLTV